MKYRIAVILTCFNRKEKTLACLNNLFCAQPHDVVLSVYLTDDGCTDGTADAIRDKFSSQDIHILQGNGSLYWAGGMCFAWKEALKERERWDFYLLLNDDTYVMDNLFVELFAAHQYAIDKYGTPGIYSGITCDIHDSKTITYGGAVYLNASRSKFVELKPIGIPQMTDKTNANILLVSREVVNKVGIFFEGYIHSGSDYDYGLMVRKAGFPALVTPHICGRCEFDHISDAEICQQFMRMSLKERCKYLENPLHREHDYLLFVRRHNPKKYPITWMLHKIRCYFPSLYMYINKIRGTY